MRQYRRVYINRMHDCMRVRDCLTRFLPDFMRLPVGTSLIAFSVQKTPSHSPAHSAPSVRF